MKTAPLSTSMISASLTSLIFTVLTFVSGVVLARCLGEVGRGQYGVAYFWAQFLISFGSLSFFEAAIVRRDQNQAPESYLSSMILAAGVLAALAVSVFGAAVAMGLVKIPGVEAQTLVWFVAGCVLVSLLSRSMSTVENMRHNFGLLNFERVFSPFVFVVFCIVGTTLFEATVLNIMIAFVLSIIPLFLMRLYRFRNHLLSPLKVGFAGSTIRLGGRFHVAAALTLIATQLDRLIIVSAWTPDRLGHYFVAVSVAGAGLAVVSQALGLTLLPMLSGVEGVMRRDRLERLFRYTILATAVFVLLIYAFAPLAIPLVYGQSFVPAVAYAQGLSLALAPLPLRTIVLEANRSIGKDRPGVEMAVASLAVFLVVFAATRFSNTSDLFVAIGLSNLAAILVGVRHPWLAGDLRLSAAFVPKRRDLTYLGTQMFRYASSAAGGRPWRR